MGLLQTTLPRPSGLVDYEDDEDYKPLPKRQSDKSYEDEGLAGFPLKRKLVTKEEPEPKRRLLQSPKGMNPAPLCSTLSQAVLPNKKPTGAGIDSPQLDANKSSDVEGSIEMFDDTRNAAKENPTKGEADCLLLSPKSSPEMAVNGS